MTQRIDANSLKSILPKWHTSPQHCYINGIKFADVAFEFAKRFTKSQITLEI